MDQQKLLKGMCQDENTPGHVILRQPGQAAANPHLEAFAKHCHQFFVDWSQQEPTV